MILNFFVIITYLFIIDKKLDTFENMELE